MLDGLSPADQEMMVLRLRSSDMYINHWRATQANTNVQVSKIDNLLMKLNCSSELFWVLFFIEFTNHLKVFNCMVCVYIVE